MPRKALLQVSTSIKLDGTGSGTASIGPTGQGEVWQDVTVSVHVATNTKEATCRMYVGGGSSGQFFIDTSTWGSTGASSSNTPPTIPVGQAVFAAWSGGDANVAAQLVVTGTRLAA